MVDTIAASRLYSTRYSSHVTAFEQSNVDRRRLDRECCHSHLVASLGESLDRDPGALFWCLRSLGTSVFGFLLMSITCLGQFLDQKQTAAKPADF